MWSLIAVLVITRLFYPSEGMCTYSIVNFSIPRFQKESVFVVDQWIVYYFKIVTSNYAGFLSCGV
jgi:hypothetical protein